MDRIRYSRHLAVPGFDDSHQQLLLHGSVLVVGAGGLGSPVLLYLAAAGFGRIGIVDDDTVDLSNLQRQIIHSEGSIDQPKARSAARQIRELNSTCVVDVLETRLTTDNSLAIISQYDVVVDCTDNLPTRYLISDTCVRAKKPVVYGSVFRFEGQVSVFGLDGPCYRCLFPVPPPPDLVPSCEAAGVIGAVVGMVGMYQSIEAIKIATKIGEPLSGTLLMLDALSSEQQKIRFTRNPECAACGQNPDWESLSDYVSFCGLEPAPEITALDLKKELSQPPEGFVLIDVREEHERQEGHIGGLHIPIPELRGRAKEFDPDASVVIYCRSGVRSATAARVLSDFGNSSARSLKGGLLSWKSDVDPSVVVA